MISNFKEVKSLWNEFRQLPFPRELHDDKYDILELELIDTYVSGCISSYVDNVGNLEESKKDLLKVFLLSYEKVEIQLSKDGKEYFGNLKKMADLILN